MPAPTDQSSAIAVCLSLARAIGRSRNVEELCDIALDALTEGLHIERSAILLRDGEGVMRFCAHRGLSQAYRQAVEGHSPWAADAADPQPIVVPDASQAADLGAFAPAISKEGIGALVFVPLVSHGRVNGKFMLYYRAPYAPSVEEMQLAELIAAHVGFAVELTQFESHARRVLSHDLRTPLNTILGWVKILESGASPEKVTKGLDVIGRSARTQAQMIDEALES
jgi:GAF domain-containing protein